MDSRNSHGTTSLPQSSSSSSEFSYFSSVTGDINSCESATIVDVKEEEGDSTIIRFNGYRLNEPVADALFSSCYP